MRISVFGLGYVGAVTTGCLSSQGHSVVGVDVSMQKVEAVNRGESPIIEPGLAEMLAQGCAQGRVRATTDVQDAISSTDASIVCVGTPSAISGALDLRFVRQVVGQIAAALARKNARHVVILRSTMLPGSTGTIVAELLQPLLEREALEVFYFPEFLREGVAVQDFLQPSLTVVGTRPGIVPSPELMALFGSGAVLVDWTTAEMIKYACNAFHATKITFANEIGRIGKQLQIDSSVVMSLLCQDHKLNLSPYYLKPGNPFGGSCLPKDVRALTHSARQLGIAIPMLENLLPSNDQHLRTLLLLIEESGQSEVAILGLSFKTNTDDLRESAMVEVAQILLGRGYKVRIFDPQLNLARLVGNNKRLIDVKMPHLATLLHSDLRSAVGTSGLVLAAQKCAGLAELSECITARHHVLDVNGWPELRSLPCRYEGLCW